MSETPQDLPDDVADFDDLSPAFAVTEELLTALAREDYDALHALRESTERDWWNVTWTLALLLRGFRLGEPAAVALVESMLGGEPEEPEAR